MRSGIAVLAAMLMLGACTSDPAPKEPTPTPTTPTPTATPPTMPPQAKKDTPSGAANFVTYYVATFNFAARSGNVQPMTEAAPRCEPCAQYAADFEKLKGDPELSGKDVWTVKDLSVGAGRDPIELDAKVEVLEEGISDLTFVLNSKAPFEVRDIYIREK